MIEFIKNVLGSTSWGIIALVAEFALAMFAAGLAYLSLKIWPPKKEK